ncbi:MAG TPA: hypothetical protein PLB10_01510 [Thiolinea sp.]|nr:hypothetical protein [Thiolinea sp.]
MYSWTDRSVSAGFLTLLLGTVSGATAVHAEGIVSLSKTELKALELENSANHEPAYVDNLINADMAEDLPPEALPPQETKPDRAGYRSWRLSPEFRHAENALGYEQRSSLGLQLYTQSAGFGDFTLQLESGWYKSVQDETGFSRQDDGLQFTLQQDNLLLNPDWSMQNSLGINQTFHNSLFSRGSRLSLPSRTLQGVTSRIYSTDTEIRLAQGELGQVSDVARFLGSGSDMTGLGLTRRLNQDWMVGFQSWQVQQPEGDSREYALMLDRAGGPEQARYHLQWLQSEDGQGVELEAGRQVGRATHQLNAYHIDGELSWMGDTVASTGSGAYWRMSYNHPLYQFNTGLDWQQYRGGNQLGLRQSVAYAFNQDTRLGADLSHSRTDADTASGQRTRAAAYVARQLASGSSDRLQLAVQHTDGSSTPHANGREANTDYELDYSRRWLLGADQELGMQLSWSGNPERDDASIRSGLDWRRDAGDDLQFGTSLYLDHTRTDTSSRNNLGGRVFGNFHFGDHWSLNASLDHSRGEENDAWQSALQLALTWQGSSGRVLSQRERRSGSVRGLVFLDENQDGIRQPLEKPAAGVQLQLKGFGLPVTTDRNGEFELNQVPVGKYRLSVDESTIPLPWELAETTEPEVQVELRSTRFLSVPLVQLGAVE